MNGLRARKGQQVQPGRDLVAIDGRRIELTPKRTYLMVNKPAGLLTAVSDPRGRPTIMDRVTSTRRLFPVGRLDLQSRGLLLLTDDGELAMRLMHPRYGVEKEYRVMISGHPQAPALRRLARGMVVDGEAFQPVEVRILSSTQSATTLSMVLREGRKREVRRLWQALGHRVLDLQRVRIDGLRLGTLAEGETRPLTDAEVERLKGAVI